MDDRLVFDLVWETAVRPSYLARKRRCADELHIVLCSRGLGLGGVTERYVGGMFELLSHVSEQILASRGLCSEWRQREVWSGELLVPLRVRALDLAVWVAAAAAAATAAHLSCPSGLPAAARSCPFACADLDKGWQGRPRRSPRWPPQSRGLPARPVEPTSARRGLAAAR